VVFRVEHGLDGVSAPATDANAMKRALLSTDMQRVLAQRRGQEVAMTPCRTRNPRFAVAQGAGRAILASNEPESGECRLNRRRYGAD
jgi:hypothetical protein